MAFPKGHKKLGGIKKGQKQRKTQIREKIDNIDDLKPKVLKVWNELINSKKEQTKAFASKEIAKYIFPTKREHSGNIAGIINFTVNPKIGTPNVPQLENPDPENQLLKDENTEKPNE